MTNWDLEYIKLCKKILKVGKEVENRTGVNTIKIPSYHLHFDLQKEFPVLQSKQLYFRQAILEMLWIYQAQSNDVRWLQERNVNIWNEWEIDEDGKWRAIQNVIKDGKLEKKEIERTFDKKYAHTIGTAYGYIVNKFNLIDNLIDKLKNNPTDRRMLMSLWQDDYLDTAVLPSCVWSSEWDVTDGKLNAWVHQRSCDVPLGLPFNVTQYATLLCLLAKTCNLEPGTLDWSIKDAHIYVNQVEGIKEQIKRYNIYNKLKKKSKKELEELLKSTNDEITLNIIDMILNPEKPEIWLNDKINNFYDYDNSKDCKDIKIKKYKHTGPIHFDITK